MIASLDAAVLDELRAIIGDDDRVLDNMSSRVVRTRVPAPFPVHRWGEHLPHVAVLPKTAQEVSEVVKLANRLGIPVVPRAGGTGLSDGAVPMRGRGGILVDVKLMNQIHEIDLVDRTVTVGPGINMLKLNEELRPHGVFYPDDPASYPCSLVGGRIGTGGWSLLGSRFGHTRDLVISMEVVLPTGEIVEIAEGGGRKLRKSSTGLTLKHLFTGHQGTLGICTEATLELVPRPETEFAAFFAFDDYMKALPDDRRADEVGPGHDRRRRALRRVEAALPAPRRRGLHPAAGGRAARRSPSPCTGAGRRSSRRRRSSWRWAGRRRQATSATRSRRATGRRATIATRRPLHGRTLDGQVVPMSWHCEDAALNYSVLPQVREEWHAIVDRYIREYGIFDDWGMFAYTSGAHKPWADYLVEIDVGIWEQRLDETNWDAWVRCKREISEVSLKYGGSMTACHGATREGDAELVPTEMGSSWEVVKRIKRALDPNNVMNPGKQSMDEAYE